MTSIEICDPNSGAVVASGSVGYSTATIGRSSTCTIIVPQNFSAVSSIHAQIRIVNSRIEIYDGLPTKYSTNGLYINSTLVPRGQWIKLNSGDIINLGKPGMKGSALMRITSSTTNASQLYSSPNQSVRVARAPSPTLSTVPPLNVAIVRPERTRGRLKSVGNLLFHILSVLILILILPAFTGSAFSIGIMVVGILAFEIYFIPTTIAFARDLPNRFAILVLNLLLGWTLIGLVISLVWSLTAR